VTGEVSFKEDRGLVVSSSPLVLSNKEICALEFINLLFVDTLLHSKFLNLP